MKITSGTVANVLFSLACLVVIAVGVTLLLERFTGPASPSAGDASTSRALTEFPKDLTIDIAQASVSVRGAPKVALIEFSDFQCPYCGRYARDTHSKIEREFVDSGLVAYAFFNFPLERIHPLALRASEAVECAGVQRRFFEMYVRLFGDQDALGESQLFEHARALDLREPEFRTCLAGQVLPRIRAQMDVGERSGVKSTPTFFVGVIAENGAVRATKKIVGPQSYATFASALKSAIGGS